MTFVEIIKKMLAAGEIVLVGNEYKVTGDGFWQR